MFTLSFPELDKNCPVLIVPDKNAANGMHRHSFFELVYITGGEAEEILEDGSILTVTAGDCFLIDLGRAHGYRPTAKSGDFSLINCLFLPELIDPSLASAKSFPEVMAPFLSRTQCRIPEDGRQFSYHDKSGFLGSLIGRICREFERREIGYTDMIRHLLLTVLITLVRGELRRADAPPSPATRVTRFVEGHYNEHLTLGAVAEKLGFSLPYLSALFKKECGVTFRDYLSGVRMKHAATLLCGSDLSVDAVARLVGYEDPAFFYKSFRKLYEMTPDAYRKTSAAIRS